jgi:hypothetical protein
MSAPRSLDEARRDGHDDTPWRCVECGLYYDSDDFDFDTTPRGPVCARCVENGEGAA